MNRIARILIIAFMFSTVSNLMARAAEVTLVYSNPVVTLGSTFSVDITIDLDEETGEQLAGGVIDLGYDDSVVEILDVAIDPYWDFLPDPGSKTGPGQWEGIGFDVFVNPPVTGSAVIARITLEALAAGTSQLAILPPSQFFSATAEFFPPVTGASIRVNTLPVATDQVLGTDEDTATSVTLSGSDDDGDDLTYAVVTVPANGTLSGTAPDLTYTPAADFNDSDSFTFQVNDGNADSNIATVSITVSPVEDVPVADDRAATTDEDIAAAITLTGSDADGDPLTFSVITDPANGSLSGTAPDLTYTPAADFYGTDSFTFQGSDGKTDSNIATVSITVNAVNDAPAADAGLDETVVVGSTVSLDGSNSGDVEDDVLTFMWTLVAIPAESTAVLSDPAAVNPSFFADLIGDYVVELVASDGTDDSAPATVTITAGVDTDSDGVPQSIDNCTAVANSDQLDTDSDGYGNLCDGDLNNDGSANTLDFQLYILAHRTVLEDTNYDPDADFNGDGAIDTLDLNIYKGLHRLPPGPSCCSD